jgi:hypothetical protein
VAAGPPCVGGSTNIQWIRRKRRQMQRDRHMLRVSERAMKNCRALRQQIVGGRNNRGWPRCALAATTTETHRAVEERAVAMAPCCCSVSSRQQFDDLLKRGTL